MSLLGRNRLFSLPRTTSRLFSTTSSRSDFHFDTHHFVQRLEREGLNRAQAEGIMSAMAEVIDESIRNMTSNMVTKAEQEKVCIVYELIYISIAETYPFKNSIIILNKSILRKLSQSFN